MTEKEDIFSKQQMSLDRVTIYNRLSELKNHLKEVESRLLKAETMLETLQIGQSLMAAALEAAGLMKNGEPVATAAVDKPRNANWDPSRIKWSSAMGAKGEYERYPAKSEKAESTSDYQSLLADLKKHDSKLSRDGIFYWLFNDKATIGRKRK